MNYTSINIISFFQGITKARLVPFSKACISICCIGLFYGCISTPSENIDTINYFQVEDSQLTVNTSELTTQESKGLVFYKSKLFTGIATQMYPNKFIAEEIHYVEGKKHGMYQKWFIHGAISFQTNYDNGIREGASKTWWKNGNLRTKSNYKHGIGNGKQYQYYQNGNLFKIISLVNGKEEGLQQSWRENGKIYNNYEAKSGRIFGLKRANLCFSLQDEQINISPF